LGINLGGITSLGSKRCILERVRIGSLVIKTEPHGPNHQDY